jgi:hypothetical protein
LADILRTGVIPVGRPTLQRTVASIAHHQATAGQLTDQTCLAKCGGREFLPGRGGAGAGGRANHRQVGHGGSYYRTSHRVTYRLLKRTTNNIRKPETPVKSTSFTPPVRQRSTEATHVPYRLSGYDR